MAEEAGPSLEKIRDDAIRALNSCLGLTPQQISVLRLGDVHLATRSLVLAADAYALGGAPEKPQELMLDEQTQRALIAWLVVRPDSPNDHLFPGSELEGLDTSIIERVLGVVVGEKTILSEQLAPSTSASDVSTSPVEAEAPAVSEAIPEEAASLEEIETLRKELAAVDEGWSPVSKPEPSQAAAPPPERQEAPTSIPEAIVRRPKPAAPAPPPPPPPRPPHPAVVARSRTARPSAPKPTPSVKPDVPKSPASKPMPTRMPRPTKEIAEEERRPISPLLVAAATLFVIACCAVSIWGVAWLVGGNEAATEWLAQVLPVGISGVIATSTPTPTETPSPVPTATPVPTDTPTPTLVPTETPTPIIEQPPTPTPIIIVVTATPTPEPPPTPRRVPTNTPVPAEAAEAAELPEAAYKYPAPKLLEPENGGKIGGSLAYLKWEPVGPLAEDEWYAVRLIYLQQGQPVYQGDDIKETTWRVPERFYYQADGPALLYRWYVYVERKNPDGTATQLSPNSEEFVFRWE
ncbi:MAG: hypothetical protein ACUVSF_07970 [Anaerolineae bacterium]